MAVVPLKIYAGTPGTGNATLYTVPANTKVLVKQVILNNSTASAATITLTFDGVALMTARSIPANTLEVVRLTYPLVATDLIAGSQGTANAIVLHITGATY